MALDLHKENNAICSSIYKTISKLRDQISLRWQVTSVNSKFVGHSTEIIRQSKIKGPLTSHYWYFAHISDILLSLSILSKGRNWEGLLSVIFKLLFSSKGDILMQVTMEILCTFRTFFPRTIMLADSKIVCKKYCQCKHVEYKVFEKLYLQ